MHFIQYFCIFEFFFDIILTVICFFEGLDMSLMITEFLQQTNTLVRGLAHPLIFMNSNTTKSADSVEFAEGNEAIGRRSQRKMDPVVTDVFEKFGAVEVSPGSLFKVSFHV